MKKGRVVVILVWAILFVVLWESVSWSLIHLFHDPMADSKLPYLHKVIAALFSQGNVLLRESFVTLLNSAFGFVLGAVVGILLAILMSASRTIEEISFPYLILSQMIPVLGLAPIVYGIVHDEIASRIIISGYITFFPVSINMLGSLKSVEKEKRELLYAYATKPISVYTKLFLPASLPGLFSGLKIAAPLSVTAAILVELMGAQHGIGVLILRNLYYGPAQSSAFWASVLVSALLGILSFELIVLAERICLPWKASLAHEGGDGK